MLIINSNYPLSCFPQGGKDFFIPTARSGLGWGFKIIKILFPE
jgi:hypothetical protein